MKSTREFARWTAHDASTWSFRVFQKYDDELDSIWESHISSSKFTYKTLGEKKAKWEDLPSAHFDMKNTVRKRYKDLRSWSDSFNLFDNWTNLNAVLTTSSNLETYLASVIAMALDSNPGLIVGVSKSLDGALVLKHRRASVFDIRGQIDACTRGDWSSRIDAFENLFGECPAGLRSSHGNLEELRGIRNRIGHAFGRDIEAARKHGLLKILPMESLSRERATKIRKSVWKAAKSIDKFLLHTHIGDFEAVRFYHHLYPSLHKHVPAGQRAMYLKKAIGRFGAVARGKTYCKGLVDYWESI